VVEQVVSLLVLGTLLLAAYGVGRPVVRGLRVAECDRLTATVWSLAAGLVIWGTALAGLGLIGGLNRLLVVAVSLAAALWGFCEIVRDRLDPQGQDRDAALPGHVRDPDVTLSSAPPAWLTRGMVILAVAAVAGSLVGALAPPTAGDALCYHLELPKRFLDAGRLVYLPYHDNSTFPLLVEMWYLWALALDGSVAAQLVHWVAGILFALATVVLARPIVGRRWATLAGAVAVLTPGVNNQMTAAMNDVALALLVTLFLAAWWRAVVNEEGSGWLVLAGLAAGGALATKYIALVFGAAVAANWLGMLWRRPAERRSLARGAMVVAVVAASVGGPWYVRAAWHRGNPVYPFLAELQRGGPRADAPVTLPASKAPLGHGPRGLAAAPWQVTMHPERFGGRGHQLGVLFLAALPGLWTARRLRGLGMLLMVATVYGLLWCLLRQNVRFLFPIVSAASVAIVWVWMEMRRFPARSLACAVAVQAVILIVFALHAVDRSRAAWTVAIGVESREEYLARNEPTFGVASLANMLLGPRDRILSDDSRLFYFDAPITQEKVFRRAYDYPRHVARPEDLSGVLRGAGFTHLLLVERASGRGEVFDPTLSRLAGKDPAIERLVGCTTRDADGGVRRYRLMKLGNRPPAR